MLSNKEYADLLCGMSRDELFAHFVLGDMVMYHGARPTAKEIIDWLNEDTRFALLYDNEVARSIMTAAALNQFGWEKEADSFVKDSIQSMLDKGRGARPNLV